MHKTRLSARSLTERIETLSRRKTNIEREIERELNEGAADAARVSQLRQETTGLRNAIRVTRTVLSQISARSGVMN